jgi:hypothetical protein
MHRCFSKIPAIVLLMSATVYGQSLGDVARENREKQGANDSSSTPQPRVITNKDLPKDPDADQEQQDPSTSAPAESESAAGNANVADHRSGQRSAAEQRANNQRAINQWKRQILAQKNRTATLQAHIDQINASIRSANGSVQYEGPTNRYQARQMERVAEIRVELDEQNRKLTQMQEAARRAGMRSAVYDPAQ